MKNTSYGQSARKGVGPRGKPLSAGILLCPFSQRSRTTLTRYWEAKSVSPTPSHGKWPSLSVDGSTVVLPSSLRTGCCLQPTAKPGMKAGLKVLRGTKGLEIRESRTVRRKEPSLGAEFQVAAPPWSREARGGHYYWLQRPGQGRKGISRFPKGGSPACPLFDLCASCSLHLR